MLWTDKTPLLGDIVRTKYSFYYHYGIFKDENTVIQFGLPDGPSRPASDIKVITSDVYTFLAGGTLEVGVAEKDEKSRLRPPEEIVRIAESRIGEGGYDILHNNCEHFVNACAFGEARSSFLDGVREKIKAKLSSKK